jgi:D-psicose/D-tagatose/L-ribulose 3-epimerase
MKFGINTILFASPFTDESLKYFEKFKEWGYDGVEITIENKGDINYKKTLYKLDENNLSCTSIGGAFGPDRDLRGTKNQQQNSRQYIRDCIDACVALRCGLFMGPFFSSVGRANMETDEARKEQWSTVMKNLKEVCKYAEEKGVYMALEPLNRFETDFINTCYQARRMVGNVGSPMLKIHLDTFHMNIEEKSLSRAIIDAGDLLYNVHASENDRGTPGTGHVDWSGVKNSLKKIGYDKAIVIESFTKDVKIIAKAASIWRDIEKSNEDLAINGIKFLRSFFH